MATLTQEQSPIQRLPLELRLCILNSLADVESLGCAALTCRALYSAFKHSEEGLIQNVLINCIGLSVLPEATIAHQCSPPYLRTHVDKHLELDNEKAEQLFDYASKFLQQLNRKVAAHTTWSMRDALLLGEFHLQVVSCLTDRFICACSETSHVLLEESLQTLPASQAERERIARALYRFEIFRKLFGYFAFKEDELRHYSTVFFCKFAPWESAQLGCINDFLAREIIPIFNDVAEHDIVWGENLASFDTDVSSSTIQYFLAQGLERIHAISACESYEDRERALKVEEMPPRENEDFLFFALVAMNSIDQDECGLENILETPPFCTDGDAGSEEIWQLSLEEAPLAIYEDMDWPYRRWGYVMWDYDRLQALGVLDLPWNPAKESEEKPAMAATISMAESWDARSDIYRRGGRGWWSQYDESRIIWPKGAEQQVAKKVPGSLEEAKAFWRVMKADAVLRFKAVLFTDSL